MKLRLTPIRAIALAVGILLACYVVYTSDAAYVNTLAGAKLPLTRPLNELPLRLGNWTAEDVPLEEGVARVAGADDYVNRRCRSLLTGETVMLYVAYYGSHRSIVGHHPDRCYVAFGWKRETGSTEMVSQPGSPASTPYPVAVRRFRRGVEQVTVLSLYNAGGLLTADRDQASRAAHRAVGGANRNYLLRIQVSLTGSPPVPAVLRLSGSLLNELLPALASHLPDSVMGVPGASRE